MNSERPLQPPVHPPIFATSGELKEYCRLAEIRPGAIMERRDRGDNVQVMSEVSWPRCNLMVLARVGDPESVKMIFLSELGMVLGRAYE